MHNLIENPLHLGLGATAIPQPPFTGMDWYQGYGERHDADGAEGRLVSIYRFSESWDSWEMHPLGDEVVLCLSGQITLHQEFADGSLPASQSARTNMLSTRPVAGIPPMSKMKRPPCSSPQAWEPNIARVRARAEA